MAFVNVRSQKAAGRRKPQQWRARQTVEAILDAVIRVLKREGVTAINTNHIAEVAGVSIGSVYQYFPDKRAIFVALHQRHVDAIDRVINAAFVNHASSSLDELVRGLVAAMIQTHELDPELHELLLTEVPHKADGTREFAVRFHGAFRLAISSRHHDLKRTRDLDTAAFVMANMVEALSHGAVLRRPAHLSLVAAKEEVVRAIIAYLRA